MESPWLTAALLLAGHVLASAWATRVVLKAELDGVMRVRQLAFVCSVPFFGAIIAGAVHRGRVVVEPQPLQIGFTESDARDHPGPHFGAP